jgi:hypothetical protein
MLTYADVCERTREDYRGANAGRNAAHSPNLAHVSEGPTCQALSFAPNTSTEALRIFDTPAGFRRLLRLYSGSIQTLSRLYSGSIKVLLKLC